MDRSKTRPTIRASRCHIVFLTVSYKSDTKKPAADRKLAFLRIRQSASLANHDPEPRRHQTACQDTLPLSVARAQTQQLPPGAPISKDAQRGPTANGGLAPHTGTSRAELVNGLGRSAQLK